MPLYGAAAPFAIDGMQLTVGESIMPRDVVTNGSVAIAGSTVRFTYWRCSKSQTANSIRMISGATAGAATSTVNRMAIYTIAANGDLTLGASTAHDANTFIAASTSYTRALTTPQVLVRGTWYAHALLVVGAGTIPTIVGGSGAIGSSEGAIAPRIAGSVAGTALPASVLAANVVASGVRLYAAILP